MQQRGFCPSLTRVLYCPVGNQSTTNGPGAFAKNIGSLEAHFCSEVDNSLGLDLPWHDVRLVTAATRLTGGNGIVDNSETTRLRGPSQFEADGRGDDGPSTSSDMTTVGETQKALERSRERYRLLVEQTREYAMFTMDEQGLIDTWNIGAQRILGYTEEEALGRSAALTYTSEDRAAGVVEQELQVARDEGQAMNERWHVRKDGSCFWASVVVTSLWENGALRGYAKVMRDNTAKQEADEAVRRSEERMRRIFDIATVGIVFFDSSGTIVDANKTFLDMVGFTRSDVDGGKLSWQMLTPPEWKDRSLEELEKLRVTGRIGPYEKEYWRKDGSRCWFLFAGVALEDGGIFEFVIDISDRKRVEQALRERERELSALNETLEERVQARTGEVRVLATELTLAEQEERDRIAQVLHDDLQQRLYALQIQFDLLREEQEQHSREVVQGDFVAIEEELLAAIRTTRHLSGDLSPPILHNEGLREAIAWLANQVQEQFGLEVAVEADESFTAVDDGLRVLLFQAVRELLFNVVKHANAPRALVSLRRANGRISIRVQDEGQGFNAKAVQARARTGMGLGTLEHRLNLVDGELMIETAPGAGTRAVIVAPLRLEPAS